ncbi:MAG TPA: hypothetical protein VF338_07845, partial [Leptolinea sp.]
MLIQLWTVFLHSISEEDWINIGATRQLSCKYPGEMWLAINRKELYGGMLADVIHSSFSGVSLSYPELPYRYVWQ